MVGSSINDALPDGKLRLLVAHFLASSVETAHRAHEDCWGLTVVDDGGLVHLNVGMPYAISAGEGLNISVLSDAIPPELRKGRDFNLIHDPTHRSGDVFKSVFGSRILSVAYTTASRMEEILAAAEQCHVDFIKRAATSRRNPRTHVGHSVSGLLQLGKIVHRNMPVPRYARSAVQGT